MTRKGHIGGYKVLGLILGLAVAFFAVGVTAASAQGGASAVAVETGSGGRYIVVFNDDVADPRGLALGGRLRSANLDHRAAARDFDRAIRAYAESGASAPPEIFLERARALVDADPGQIDRALRGLNEGLELLGRPVTLELAALELESSAGRYEAALERIDRHLAVRPGSTAWRMRRGAVLERGGRHAEAGAEYRRVLAGLERLPDHRRNLPGPARQRTEARSALQRFEHAEDGADE